MAHVRNKSHSSQTGDQLDKRTLVNFKRLLAVRQDFERCDGVEIFWLRHRYAWKLRRQGITPQTLGPILMTNVRKAVDLNFAYHEIVSEMCQTEHRRKLRKTSTEMEETERVLNDMGDKAPAWLKRALRGEPDRRLFYCELVPLVSHYEILLEADAVQQQPLLNDQERRTVTDIVKEYLERRRLLARIETGSFLAFASLTVWGYYSLEPWLERRLEKERDFEGLHTRDDGVE